MTLAQDLRVSLDQAFLGFTEYLRAALKIINTNPVLNYGYRIQTLFHIHVNGSPPRPFKGISSTKV